VSLTVRAAVGASSTHRGERPGSTDAPDREHIEAQGPTTPERWSDPASGCWTQLRLSAVSSMTNDVCSEESSVPVKPIVTVWPAKAETLNERNV